MCSGCNTPLNLKPMKIEKESGYHLRLGIPYHILNGSPYASYEGRPAEDLDQYALFCGQCFHKGIFYQKFKEFNLHHSDT